jgi:hypothetical protein
LEGLALGSRDLNSDITRPWQFAARKRETLAGTLEEAIVITRAVGCEPAHWETTIPDALTEALRGPVKTPLFKLVTDARGAP